jgi:O-acetyl-ADP-ribose deacetylase (regulator of RNase III)
MLYYYSGMEKRFPSGKVLRLVNGDITQVAAGAIVNAANSRLAGGGGVDGAIHRAGGPEIMRELEAIRQAAGGCPTGSAVATSAGKLPAQFVFHAVGPIYRDGRHGEAELLASCYRTALRMAEERRIETISFPSISTGVYGYPIEEAAPIALAEVSAHLERPGTTVREVILVLFGRADYDVYAGQFREAAGKQVE